MKRSQREPDEKRLAPRAVVGRLSLYLRQLERTLKQGDPTISSSRLGNALGINDAQVRKDLAFFGQFGQPGIGYQIEPLASALRQILGIDREWPTAIFGMGNLGRALVKYRGFRLRRFQVVAVFDNDPTKVGKSVGSLVIESLDRIGPRVAELGITLGVLCVPAEAAQTVASLAVAAGVQGLLNFAPVPVAVPPSVQILAVDLSVQLELLAYQVLNVPRTRVST